ncbi:MAG: hypothetical protein IBX64_04525 [Actinobacteria bacterium]|nr:hypothetical protein [Actinomycetota bacterium]
MNKSTEEVVKKIEAASKDKRISCTMARKVAEELDISLLTVGDACNELGIKIYACELGCF